MTRLRDLLARLFAYIALVPFRKVTVGRINDEIVRGRVRSAWVGSRIVVLSYMDRRFDPLPLRMPTEQSNGAVVRSRHDEGVSWCRGWRGRDVDALLAGWALR